MIELNGIAYKPDSFLAVFEPRSQAGGSLPLTPPLDFHVTIETDDYSATLYYGEREMLSVSPDGQTFLVLAGEIYRPKSASPGQTLLDLYQRRGLDFTKDLNGRYSLVLVDRRAGRILIGTERGNALKVLVRWDNDRLFVSNSIYLHAVRGQKIDRTAVAAYFTLGYPNNDRTLFEGVRMLDGASVYQLHDGKLDQHQFWRIEYAPPTAPASLSTLKKELGDLMVQAVRIRLPSDRPTYLSLSGGYDSRAVLGIMANYLHVDDVHCFSYALGEPVPGSDEYVAGQLAAVSGYSHRNVPSFDGDAVSVLTRSAHLGGGLADCCDEIDAWMQLGASVEHGPMPVLFTGDTVGIRMDIALTSRSNALLSAGPWDFSMLSWLEKLIGPPTYQAFLAASREDAEAAIRRAAPTTDLYALRDTLLQDNYTSHGIGNWREYYAGRWFRIATPLLDDDIQDFFLRVPSPLRRGKRLFMATVSDMLPQLFALPRAHSSSYTDYWPEAIQRQKAELINLIQGQPSPLDEMIAPEVLMSLLVSDLSAYAHSNARLHSMLKKAYRLIQRAHLYTPALARPSFYRTSVGAQTFLRRALVLRRFLAEMSSRAAESSLSLPS